MILGSNKAVEGGQVTVNTTVSMLDSIQANIGGLSSLVLEIGTAMQEQANTSDEVARAVEDSAHQANQNAAATTQLASTVHEVAHTASDLSQVAERLAGFVAQFQT
jgi:methyl-accepting chemotaxis protein